MNNVTIVGRLVRDPEVRYAQNDKATCFAKFSVAVNRSFKSANGSYEADFINCKAIGKTAEFVEKYKEDGFIWYFDIFALTAEDTYRALWQMNEAGWFSNVRGIILGRVRFPNTMVDMTYQEAVERLFPDLPLIMEADIGHVKPSMTIINGAIGHVRALNGKGEIELFRKE